MRSTRARHSRIGQLLVILLLPVASLSVSTAAVAAAPAKTLTVLQLNLCNSGKARCFKQVNNDGSVGEAVRKINAMKAKPDIITLNEVCRRDVAAIAAKTGYALSGSNFFPARRKNRDRTTTNYKCSNRRGYRSEDYGVGFLVRNHGDQVQVLASQEYASTDGGAELRVMACAEYHDVNVCTTHLSLKSGTAKKQCQELKGYATSLADTRPTVVGGDFNLKAPDAQSCVPRGFFRKGDGGVQHVMASAHFSFGSSKRIDLKRTDHDGWLVELRLK